MCFCLKNTSCHLTMLPVVGMATTTAISQPTAQHSDAVHEYVSEPGTCHEAPVVCWLPHMISQPFCASLQKKGAAMIIAPVVVWNRCTMNKLYGYWLNTEIYSRADCRQGAVL